jgi:hypothetical protein
MDTFPVTFAIAGLHHPDVLCLIVKLWLVWARTKLGATQINNSGLKYLMEEANSNSPEGNCSKQLAIDQAK